jgi:hypothetical protein
MPYISRWNDLDEDADLQIQGAEAEGLGDDDGNPTGY